MSKISQLPEDRWVEAQADSSDEYLYEEPVKPDDEHLFEETAPTEVSTEANADIPPPAVTQQLPEVNIDQAVARINELANQTIYEGHTRIGEYVLQTFFNNDHQLAQSKNPFKTSPSYRTLCKREDLLISPANLNRSVRVAIQERFFQEKELDVQNLTFTHKAVLVRIPNNPEEVEFVRNLLNNPGTTRELSDMVKNFLPGLASPREPDATKIIVSHLFSLKKYIEKHEFNGNQIQALNFQNMREATKQRLPEEVLVMEAKMESIHNIITEIKTALNI